LALAPSLAGTLRPRSNEQRSECSLSIISRHTTRSFTAVTSATLSWLCCTSARMSARAAMTRSELPSKPLASCTLTGPGE
jgi:hypothetical protein